MSEKKTFISPISIDLGAKNTGVYFAHYSADMRDFNSSQFQKFGKVYHLEKDKYTLLMRDRIAHRHQKRGHDRRQMVKRLFKLIWEKHFGLEWDKKVQQTISFLLNRRGFTFLTEDYNKEILSHFPKEVYEQLPEELKKSNGSDNSYDFDNALIQWSQEGTIDKKFDSIAKKAKKLTSRLYVLSCIKKLKEACTKKINNQNIKEDKKSKIKDVSKWVLDEWRNEGITGLPEKNSEYFKNNKFNLIKYLNDNNLKTVKNLKDSIPNVDQEKKKLDQSIWAFKPEKFDFEKAEDKIDSLNETLNSSNNIKQECIKTHLHHLAFAMYKTNNELKSGSRHRSKYFEEVKKVLQCKKHTHGYLKSFCGNLHSGSFNKNIEAEALSYLICHLSNFELKPLRKYFNDIKHKTGDYWDEDRLAKIFERWILKEWRVDLKKDKYKAEGKEGDYKELKKQWNQAVGDKKGLINFWCNTDPVFTIPPYQDSNNRRPPKCQSLILNPKFLNDKYSNWKDWLQKLQQIDDCKKYIDDYEQVLKSLKSSGYKNSALSQQETNIQFSNLNNEFSYFGNSIKYQKNGDYLQARLLQFIFDRVKDDDPLKLNEIYSHAKKHRQNQSTAKEKTEAKKQLESVISKSKLSNQLKTNRNYNGNDIFEESGFLHLVCKYYKLRQKARAGRIFIQPKYRYVKDRGYENTGQFEDKNCLLTYCNRQPRQKRYQMLSDVSALLQVSSKQFQKTIDEYCSTQNYNTNMLEDKIIYWFEQFKGLKSNCEKSAKEQKNRRGSLKSDIQRIYWLIYHQTKNQKSSDENHKKEIKNIVNNSRVKEANKLLGVCEKAKEISLKVAKNIYNKSRQSKWEENLKNNPVSAIYFLAQMNNIVFKERQGNSNTCVVCSEDNAQRMQQDASNTIHSKAQRLPAIPTRIFDGAVMRMARILCTSIAEDKWEVIKKELVKGNKVCVPIITESNRFEFEPNLKTLKGKNFNDKNKKHQKSNPLQDKESRIKTAGLGICPYTDKSIGEDEDGEIDHIIPRSSQWGTLNDEANLIWASREGNNKKGENIFSLNRLEQEYKKKQFGNKSDDEIKKWVIGTIWDSKNEVFKFGKYSSFINLSPDEQKAFRHALFLKDHLLREKVIQAIDHRTRTLVNGTQRYFAEVLANECYKKIRKYNVENKDKLIPLKNLSFDYFGVEAWDSSRGVGVKDMREELVKHYRQDLKEFNKNEDSDNSPQHSYSHLIDAQIAFCMALCDHQKDGSFKLNLENLGLGLWSRVNQDTGEMKPNKQNNTYDASLFQKIQIKPQEMKKVDLQRQKPDQTFFKHRSIHRDGIYAEKYLPVLIHKQAGEVRIGFSWGNSIQFQETKENRILLYFILQFNKEVKKLDLALENKFSILSQQLKNILIDQNSKIKYFYISLNVQSIHSYYIDNYNTEKGFQKYDDKMKFLRSLAYRIERKKITSLKDAKKVLNNSNNFQVSTYNTNKIILPVKNKWRQLVSEWKKTQITDDDKFLNHFFEICTDRKDHWKTRKVFSLPVKTSEGKILIKRKSWNGDDIFQIVNDSDSRSVDAKVFTPVFDCRKKEIRKLLSHSAYSRNIFLLKQKEYCSQLDEHIKKINLKKWFSVNLNDQLNKLDVQKLEYCIDNNTRPKVRVKFSRKLNNSKQIEDILNHDLLKPKDRDQLKQSLNQGSELVYIYTGSGFSNNLKKVLIPVLTEYYQNS